MPQVFCFVTNAFFDIKLFFYHNNICFKYLFEKRSVLEKLDLEVLSAYGVFYAGNACCSIKFQSNWT